MSLAFMRPGSLLPFIFTALSAFVRTTPAWSADVTESAGQESVIGESGALERHRDTGQSGAVEERSAQGKPPLPKPVGHSLEPVTRLGQEAPRHLLAHRRSSWHLILAPLVGFLRNTIRFEYDIPTGPDETTRRNKSMTDTGWGMGLTGVFVSGRWSVVDVFFFIPKVNSSLVVGNVLSGTYEVPIWRWIAIEPTLGMATHSIKSDLRNFEDTVTKEGVTATAHFDQFLVDNLVLTPYARMSLKMHLPIQHWYVSAHVGYMFEAVRLDVSSPGGSVYVPPPIDDTKTIPPLDVQEWKYYNSLKVGGAFFIDFHYALQLRVLLDYDVTYDNFTIRAMGAAFFSRRIPLGLTAYFEYSQGIIHDNLFVFLGPAYMF